MNNMDIAHHLIFLLLFGLSHAEFLPNGCPVDVHTHHLLPHESDCSQFYYCLRGEKLLRSCPPGLYFDANIQACNWPSEVQCNLQEQTTGVEESTTAIADPPTDSVATEAPTTDSPIESIVTDPTTDSQGFLPNGCPTDIHIHLLLPHETDCAKFYYCDKGEKEERQCPPGTLFDATVKVCNWPFAVQCNLVTTTEPTTEYTTTDTQETTEPETGSQTTEQATTFDSETISITEETTGDNTEETTEEITEGTTEETTEETTEKTTEEITEGNTEETTKATTGETTEETTEEIIEENTHEITEEITEATTEEITEETTEDTTEVTTEETTQVTTEDATEEITEETTEATTAVTTETTNETTERTTEATSGEAIEETTEVTTDATTEDITKVTTEVTTEENTQATTEKTTEVTTEETTEVTTEAPICPDGVFGNIPHPEQCDAYYLCTGWNPILLFCPTNFEFDPEIGACVEIAEEGCTWNQNLATQDPDQETTVEVTEIVTSEPSTEVTQEPVIPTFPVPNPEGPTSEDASSEIMTDKEPIITESTVAETTNNPESTETSEATTESAPFVCPDGVFGNVPHPDKCDAYFLCSGWDPIPLFCPNGHEFDPTTGVCVIIAENGCTWNQSTPIEQTTAAYTTDQESTEVTDPETESQTTDEVTTLEPETTDQESSTEVTEPEPESTDTSEETTESAPFVCPDGVFGNLPHPDKCDAYFLCSGWDPIPLFCPNGYEFDPTAGGCAIIAEGGCTWNQSTAIEQTTAAYTTEQESTEVTEPDTESQTTDEATTTVPETTDQESFTEVTETQSESQTTEEATTFESETTDESIEMTTDDSTEVTTDTSVEITEPTTPLICPEGVFGNVPHPEQCDAYYLCTGWNPILLFCPSNYEFDPETGTCIKIAEGGCSWNQGLTEGTSEDPEHGTTVKITEIVTSESSPEDTNTDEPNTTDDPSTSEPSVPEPNPEGPSTDDPTIPETSEDASSENMSGEEPTTAKSTVAETTYNPDSTETTEETTESDNQDTSEETTEPAPFICPDGVFGNVPHPEKCDAYFLCSGWDPIPLFCPNGYEFDPTTGGCVIIAENGCTWNQSTPIEQTTASYTTDQESTEVTDPETESQTTDEVTTLETMTTDQESSTEVTEIESESTDTSEETTESAPFVCPDGVFGNVPHPDKCGAYFLCSGWDPIPLFCPNGYEFDPKAGGCAIIAEGGCTWNQSTAIEQTTAAYTTEQESTEVTESDTESQTTDEATTFEPETTDQESSTEVTETELESQTTEEATTSESETTDESIEMTTDDSTGVTTDASVETTEPTTPTICPEGVFGNVPHPEQCDAYYLCTGWNPILLFCPTNFEFDPKTGACAEIAEGGCTWNQGLTSEGTTEDPKQGSTVEITESSSEDTNTDEPNTTDEPSTTDDPTIPETSEDASSENTSEEEPTTAESTVAETTNNPESTSTETSEETTESAPFVCPDGVFGNVPHPDKCDAYFLCSGWEPIPLFCPNGYEFDPITGGCVIIAEGECIWDQGLTSEGTTVDPEQGTTVENTDIETSQPSTADTNTEEPETSYEPTTEEVTSAPEVTSQPEIPIFPEPNPGGPATDGPEIPETTEEASSENTSVEITPEATTEVTTPEETTAATTESSVEATEPPICPDGVFGNVPHPEQCDAYYLCTGWHPILLFCPTNYEFDPETGACIQIIEGGCNWNQNLESEATTDVPDQDSKTESEVTDHVTTLAPETTEESEEKEEDTTLEPESTENSEEIEQATTFNPETTEESAETEEVTTLKPETTAQPEVTTPATCPEGVFGSVSHPEICEAYYLCTGWNPMLLFCPTNFEFDPEKGECVPIAEGGCTFGQRNLATVSKTLNDAESVSKLDATGYIETANVNLEVAKLNSAVEHDLEELAKICPLGFKGTVPNPDRCDAFYLCTQVGQIALFCSRGFEFDVTSERCVPATT